MYSELEAIADGRAIVDVQAFGRYAQKSLSKWRKAIGQRVYHRRLGVGVITNVRRSDKVIGKKYCAIIKFQHGIEDYLPSIFLTDLNMVAMTLPDTLVKVNESTVGELTPEQQAELAVREAQRRKELEAQEHFLLLKAKYFATHHSDPSPSSPLYMILLKLDSHELLEDAEVTWLQSHRLFAVLAHHYQESYRNTRDPWLLVRACGLWRESERPEQVIVLTDYLLKHSDPSNRKLKSAVLTTRGGAFRDLGDLSEAEDCATTALRLNESYQSHNLLGAICFALGEPERGEGHFEKAVELGAHPANQERQMRAALEDAPQLARTATAEYLLRKDRERYAWAEYYLNKVST